MNVHDPQRARPRIESGREDQHVELVLVRLGAHTLGSDPSNRTTTDIDKFDIVPVERFVVRVPERRALGAKRISLRAEELGGHWVLDDLTYLLPQELRGRLIGLLIDE